MKMIFGALALALSVPAMAQQAPASDPHANHARHEGMDPSQHGQAKHDCKDCCEKMKQSNGKMECMDKKGDGKSAAPASGSHDDHSGHAH